MYAGLEQPEGKRDSISEFHFCVNYSFKGVLEGDRV